MSDLIEWLRAQLEADEQAARVASAGGRWRYSSGESVGAWTLYDEHWSIASLTVYDTRAYDYDARMPAFRNPSYVDPDANGRHIALHDPASVLADIAAKRAILDARGSDGLRAAATTLTDAGWEEVPADALDSTWLYLVRLLATAYDDRPGFREEWRP